MNPSLSVPAPARWPRFLLRGLLVVWAGFWAWFVLMVTFGEPPPPPWWIPAAWLTGLAVLVGTGWKWPAAGGLLLVAAGLWTGWYFPGTWALLAAPALALGIGNLLVGVLSRRASPAAG